MSDEIMKTQVIDKTRLYFYVIKNLTDYRNYCGT